MVAEMNAENDLALDLLAELPFSPNEQQMKVALALAKFCLPVEPGAPERVFILNGYAGTGKTSLTGALVKALAKRQTPVMLLAPTGRAAKVFAANSGHPAHTIHRKIYRHALPSGGYASAPGPRENTLRDAVFIVDEASMIATDADGGSNVLTDLIQFVYSSPGCRLILMGDTAQLPPVGQSESPAMTPEALRAYGLKVTRATMTEVARQGAGSGILFNATRLRRALGAEKGMPLVKLNISDCDDTDTVEGAELPDLIDALYRAEGAEETVVITRSNRSATDFNRGIRQTVLDREEILSPGDLLIAAKNNYYWGRKVKGLDFVANGEVLRLVKTVATESRYGLRFADVVLEPVDRPGLEFEAKVVLDCLTGTSAALDFEDTKKLYAGVYDDPTLVPAGAPHDQRVKLLRESPYWNAMQVKYAYAVTCHKAQGGQWNNVFVDLSYIPPEQLDGEFYRWLYTAVTRAKKRLFLINPPEEMVE